MTGEDDHSTPSEAISEDDQTPIGDNPMNSSEAEGDDLTIIKGIGPARRRWLSESLEVRTFRDLAAFRADEIESRLSAEGQIVSRSEIDQWIAQARHRVEEVNLMTTQDDYSTPSEAISEHDETPTATAQKVEEVNLMTTQADYTTPFGASSLDDRIRYDLSEKLISVQPLDAIRFLFNDAVDRDTFLVKRTDQNQANTLSIRYMEDPDPMSNTVTDEVAATAQSRDWSESPTGKIENFGEYTWESERVLLIGPPEDGWPLGRYVRFEFDRSLSDNAGNNLIDDKDQVIVALVYAETIITIDRPKPNFEGKTYLPWQSDDNVAGDPNDFYVEVSGRVIQKGGSEHVREITVTATSANGKVPPFEYTIQAGDIPHDTLTEDVGGKVLVRVGGTKWTPDPGPDDYNGEWAINLPLQSSDYRGAGAQAVAEGIYKWVITASVTNAADLEFPSSDTKIVYHEIYKPKVTKVVCHQVQENGGIVYLDEEGKALFRPPLRFNKKHVGPKNFIVYVKGDFADAGKFQYENSYVAARPMHVLHADISQSDDAPEGEENAEVILPTFLVDDRRDVIVLNGRQNKNDMIHTLTFSAKTKAGSLVFLNLPYDVDTNPLDIEDAQPVAVRLSFR